MPRLVGFSTTLPAGGGFAIEPEAGGDKSHCVYDALSVNAGLAGRKSDSAAS